MYFLRKKLAPYVFIFPFFLGYGVFFLYPVISAFILSFYRQQGITSASRFIGIKNYINLISDSLFIKSLINTTYYAIGSVLIILPLSLMLAYLLTLPNLRFREFFRLLFFSPYITSGVVASIIFGLVFNKDYGIINNFILAPLGVAPVAWLTNPDWVMPALILLGIWKFTGVNVLYFMVGFQNISPSYKEAAQVDGANSLQTFWYVTFPLLRPTLIFTLSLAIVGSYQLFAEPTVLLGSAGGPQNAGMTMTMYLYNVGFRQLDRGYASAIGYGLTLIIVVLTLIQLKLTRTLGED